jgi:hypothetical protein
MVLERSKSEIKLVSLGHFVSRLSSDMTVVGSKWEGKPLGVLGDLAQFVSVRKLMTQFLTTRGPLH